MAELISLTALFRLLILILTPLPLLPHFSLAYSPIINYPSPLSTFRERRFFKVANVLYYSPSYSSPEAPCRGRRCTVLSCAESCRKEESCVVFSYSRSSSTCVFSRRRSEDEYDSVGQGTYEMMDPQWDTYYLRCPQEAGYQTYGSHVPPLCLRLHLGQVKGDAARQTCVQEEGDLVRIKTLQVLNTVQSLLSDAGTDNWVWVGADDAETEGQFYWNDGTSLPRGTSLWDHPGEGGDSGEDCTAVRRTRRIIDDGCFWEASFLCQLI